MSGRSRVYLEPQRRICCERLYLEHKKVDIIYCNGIDFTYRYNNSADIKTVVTVAV